MVGHVMQFGATRVVLDRFNWFMIIINTFTVTGLIDVHACPYRQHHPSNDIDTSSSSSLAHPRPHPLILSPPAQASFTTTGADAGST